MTDLSQGNAFLTGWLPGVFIRTAAPIVAITTLNGLFTVVDAYFLGAYVGPDALSAVSLIFPGLMLLIALQSLVSNGMPVKPAPRDCRRHSSRDTSSLSSGRSSFHQAMGDMAGKTPEVRPIVDVEDHLAAVRLGDADRLALRGLGIRPGEMRAGHQDSARRLDEILVDIAFVERHVRLRLQQW